MIVKKYQSLWVGHLATYNWQSIILNFRYINDLSVGNKSEKDIQAITIEVYVNKLEFCRKGLI